MVMTKSVATKPSSTRTKSLPCHQASSRSSMAIDPSPLRALGGDAAVDGERPEQGDEHEDEGGEGGERAGGEGGDAGLVAEGGEVVDAGQAHHRVPWLGGVRPRVDMGPLGRPGLALQQPAGEPAAAIAPRRRCYRHNDAPPTRRATPRDRPPARSLDGDRQGRKCTGRAATGATGRRRVGSPAEARRSAHRDGGWRAVRGEVCCQSNPIWTSHSSFIGQDWAAKICKYAPMTI